MTDLIENPPEMADIVERLDKDTKRAAELLTDREARYLIDLYYQMQEYRKRSDNQTLALSKSGEPHSAIIWLSRQNSTLETRIRSLLDIYSKSREIGRWARSICGIGPVISAGLMAHIDITKAPTVGHIWRFAGFDPTVVWEKKQRRPWNARLKTLCWKIGESFVKVSGRDDDFYGKLYLQRKTAEQANNEAGKYAGQAAAMLLRKKFGDDTKAKEFYQRGQLPPAHIHARAKRYAVKLFLSHWHQRAYEFHFGKAPPAPYAFSILGHGHFIDPPPRIE